MHWGNSILWSMEESWCRRELLLSMAGGFYVGRRKAVSTLLHKPKLSFFQLNRRQWMAGCSAIEAATSSMPSRTCTVRSQKTLLREAVCEMKGYNRHRVWKKSDHVENSSINSKMENAILKPSGGQYRAFTRTSSFWPLDYFTEKGRKWDEENKSDAVLEITIWRGEGEGEGGERRRRVGGRCDKTWGRREAWGRGQNLSLSLSLPPKVQEENKAQNSTSPNSNSSSTWLFPPPPPPRVALRFATSFLFRWVRKSSMSCAVAYVCSPGVIHRGTLSSDERWWDSAFEQPNSGRFSWTFDLFIWFWHVVLAILSRGEGVVLQF